MNAVDNTATAQPGSFLKELINTPFLQEILRDTIVEMNPTHGPEVVRTLMWENIGMVLSLLDAVPQLANYLIGAISELFVQVDEKFPPTVLLELSRCTTEDIDTARLQAGRAAAAHIIQGLMQAAGVNVPAAIGKGITNLARSVNTLNAQDPDYIPGLTAAIMENIDRGEFSEMVNTILNAVLNQHPPLGSWARNLVAVRVKERFHTWRNKGGTAMRPHGTEKFQGT